MRIAPEPPAVNCLKIFILAPAFLITIFPNMGRTVREIRGLPAPFVSFEERVVPLPPEGWHRLDNEYFKIVFLTETALEYQINNRPGESHLEPGDALIVPCACAQHYRSPKNWSEANYVAAVIRLDPKLMVPYEKAVDTADPGVAEQETGRSLRRFIRSHFGRLRHINKATEGEIRVYLRRLTEEAEMRRIGYRFRAMALCQEILTALARRLENERTKDSAETFSGLSHAEMLVEQVRHYLDDNSKLHLTMADIARSIGRSEAYLATVFNKVTGNTVFGELKTIRIDKAKQLLLSSEMDAKEIARRTGFANPSHFNRNFRKAVGMTPLQYRIWINRQPRFARTGLEEGT